MNEGLSTLPGVLNTAVPYLSLIEQMGVHRAPVGLFAPNSQAAALFDTLWTEINRAGAAVQNKQ